ncbi:tetratricopeptide repeat protein [Chitinibacter sp. S2-10]|uniref:tetratricopeptide repeat protein n=1 Tax=Chitinibacter sp. S2-10 TaxID=3373597 RepID=UPI0039778A45
MTLPAILPQQQETVERMFQLVQIDRYEAFNFCEAALAMARAAHDDAAFVVVALQYGQVIDQHGYPEASIQRLAEAAQLASSYQALLEQAQLLNMIGRAVYTRAEYRRAMQAWIDCLELADQLGEIELWVWAQLGIAQIYDALGDSLTATALLQKAEPRVRSLSRGHCLFHILMNLGVNLFRIERYDEAMQAYQEALLVARELEHQSDIAEILFRIAELLLLQGKQDECLVHLDEAKTYALQSCHTWTLANIYGIRADVYAARQQLARALKELQAAIDFAAGSGSRHIQLRLLIKQAKWAEQVKDSALELKALRESEQLRQKLCESTLQQYLAELGNLDGSQRA